MTTVVALNREIHRDVRVRTVVDVPRNFIAVVVAEFIHLAPHYPILFSKDAETGAFYVGVMLGIDPGENLFGGTSGVYRPLNLQRGPFFTAGDELAIDLAHPAVGAGERLFCDDGTPSDYLTAILRLFQTLVPGLEQTKAFIATLLELKLIEPIAIELAFDDGSARNLEGLYTISRDRLAALGDADVVRLFRRGYLELCTLMLASLRQVPVLAERKNAALAERGRMAFG
jgi:hypothetical protein